MKRILFTTACAAILLSILCAGMQAQGATDKYPSVADIPSVLRLKASNYGGGQYKEQYVSTLLSIIRQNGRTRRELDQQDIDDLKKKRMTQMRRDKVREIIRYDADFDGKVRREEIVEAFTGDRRQSEELNEEKIERRIDTLMKADIDGDGILTMEEMSMSPAEYDSHLNSYTDLEKILALDPDKNGKISVDELEKLAIKAFHTVDADGDGILSQGERKAIEAYNNEDRRQMSAHAIFAECRPFPAPADNEQIIQISVYGGKTDAAITIPLDIEKGDKKLYIVATSSKPVVWQITGAADRISRFVLTGPASPDGTAKNSLGNDQINANATGVPAANLAFRHAEPCGFGAAYQEKGLGLLQSQAAAKRLLGRAPDSMAVSSSATSATIDAMGIVSVSSPQ